MGLCLMNMWNRDNLESSSMLTLIRAYNGLMPSVSLKEILKRVADVCEWVWGYNFIMTTLDFTGHKQRTAI